MLSRECETLCEISFLPLNALGPPVGICVVVAGVAGGQGRQRLRTLCKHIDARSSIAQRRIEKRSITEDCLLRDREEVAVLFETWRCFLWVESIQPKIAGVLPKDRRDEFEAVVLVGDQIELRERVDIL